MNKKKILLLIFALLFISLLVYSPHLNYRFPLHVDEWHQISRSLDIKEQDLKLFTKIYFNPVGLGCQTIVTILDIFVPIVPFYRFLPAINAVLISIVLFYFLSKKFNYWVAIISIFILASLKSNVNILGLWFYAPVIAAIIFDYLCLFTLEETVTKNKPKKIYLVALFLFIIAFIHQSSFLVISLVTLIYLAIRYKFVKKNIKYFLPFAILAIPGFFVLRFLSWNFTDIPRILQHLVWGPSILQINYNPFLFYGILNSLLAILGFYLTYKRKQLLSFRIWAIIPLINMFMFPLTNFTIFSAYQRYLYHFMLAAVPLSAIGAYAVIKYIYKLLKKHRKSIKYLSMALILILFFAVTFKGYYSIHEKAKLYRVIDENDYEAMLFLRDIDMPSNLSLKHPAYAEVIAPRSLGIAIFPVTKKSCTSGIFYGDEQSNKFSEDLFNANCSEKKEMLNKWRSLKYIYSYEEIDCDFLNQTFKNEKVYVYRILRPIK